MNSIMLDLETMGNGPRAAIVSIGAVVFDIQTGVLGAEFYAPISLQSAAEYGEMDASTVQWWLQQSSDARQLFATDSDHDMQSAVYEFDEWIQQIPYKSRTVWGNGSTFDNTILRHTLNETGTGDLWPYFGDRDVRTIVDLGRSILGIDPKKDFPFEGTQHNALDNAKHQAKYVSAIYQALAAKAK